MFTQIVKDEPEYKIQIGEKFIRQAGLRLREIVTYKKNKFVEERAKD